MLVDKLLLMSDAQAITADAGSTDVIDLGTTTRKLFDGEHMSVVFIVDVAADFTTTDETYAFVLQTDDNSGFSSAAELARRTITAAQLAIRTKHMISAPIGVDVERYLRAYYDVGGTTPLITVTAFLHPTNQLQNLAHYADAINIG